MQDKHLTDLSPRVLDEHLTGKEHYHLRQLVLQSVLADKSDVLHPSMQRLISRGLIETDGKIIKITEKGRRKVGS